MNFFELHREFYDIVNDMPKVRNLYCANCAKHTPHADIATMYATRCTVCNCQTSELQRATTLMAAAGQSMTAPDGTRAIVVHNTPKVVVFYVPSGEYKGYYDYDKQTKQHTVRQA